MIVNLILVTRGTEKQTLLLAGYKTQKFAYLFVNDQWKLSRNKVKRVLDTQINVRRDMEFDLDLFRFAWQIQKTEYWMSAICIANCETLHSVRGLYDKKKRLIVLFTSDVMYNRHKKQVYTAPDLLKAKNLAWFIMLASILDKDGNLKFTTCKLTATDY